MFYSYCIKVQYPRGIFGRTDSKAQICVCAFGGGEGIGDPETAGGGVLWQGNGFSLTEWVYTC